MHYKAYDWIFVFSHTKISNKISKDKTINGKWDWNLERVVVQYHEGYSRKSAVMVFYWES